MTGLYSRTGPALLRVALFGGPVLAGLAGHNWSAVPVLATLVLLFVAASRKPDLETGAGRASLAMMAATQLALVALAWGVGLGLAGLIGAIVLPLWAPIAITAAAAAIGAWALRDAAEMDVMLDSALARLAEFETAPAPTPQGAWPDPSPETEAAVARALEALRRIDGLAPEKIDPIMLALYAETGALAFDPLYDAAGRPGRPGAENEPVVDFALLRFAALPRVFDQLAARGEAGLAPMLLLTAPDPEVRAEARAGVSRLVAAALPAAQLPDPERLAELDARFPGEGFCELVADIGDDRRDRAEVAEA